MAHRCFCALCGALALYYLGHSVVALLVVALIAFILVGAAERYAQRERS